MTEFPRCALCRVTIQAETSVMFRPDGRVVHVECPEIICPVCTRRVLPGDPIRRDGDDLLHGNCWMKRHRTLIAGGCSDSPWTVIFERRLAQLASFDRAAYDDFRAAVLDAWAEGMHARDVIRANLGRVSQAV